MKKIIMLSIVGIFAGITANACPPISGAMPAGGGMFPQICYISGEVDLQLSRGSDTVQGTIGDEPVSLSSYQNFVYGDINGFPLKLNVLPRGRVDGTFDDRIPLRLSHHNGHIFGCIPCIGVREIEWSPGEM